MITKERLEEFIEQGAEVWEKIPGFGDRYSVSNFGNIKSNTYTIYHNGIKEKPHKQIIKEKLLKQHLRRDGYLSTRLIDEQGNRKNCSIHRLVATVFVDNPNNKPQINHIDGNKQNNNYKNLEWVTASENTKHAYDNKLKIISDKQRKMAREHIVKVNKSRAKKVLQYDEDFNLLNTFQSLKDAGASLGISPTCISKVCNKKHKTAGGFIFVLGGKDDDR